MSMISDAEKIIQTVWKSICGVRPIEGRLRGILGRASEKTNIEESLAYIGIHTYSELGNTIEEYSSRPGFVMNSYPDERFFIKEIIDAIRPIWKVKEVKEVKK